MVAILDAQASLVHTPVRPSISSSQSVETTLSWPTWWLTMCFFQFKDRWLVTIFVKIFDKSETRRRNTLLWKIKCLGHICLVLVSFNLQAFWSRREPNKGQWNCFWTKELWLRRRRSSLHAQERDYGSSNGNLGRVSKNMWKNWELQRLYLAQTNWPDRL